MNLATVVAPTRALEGTGLTFVTGVADSVFKDLIEELEQDALDESYVLATREDNAVALAVGAYLAGERPLVFMESAGVGTALDAITSLATVYGIPLVLLIAWAGYKGRDVPHHNSIGLALEQLLSAIEMPTVVIGADDLARPALGEALRRAADEAAGAGGPCAVLVVPTELAGDAPGSGT